MVTDRNCWICARFLGGPAGKGIVFKVKGLNIQLTVSYFQFLPLYQTLSLLQPSHHPLMPPHLDPQYKEELCLNFCYIALYHLRLYSEAYSSVIQN